MATTFFLTGVPAPILASLQFTLHRVARVMFQNYKPDQVSALYKANLVAFHCLPDKFQYVPCLHSQTHLMSYSLLLSALQSPVTQSQ